MAQNFWVRALVLLVVASALTLLAALVMFPGARVGVAHFIGWLPMKLSLWLLPPGKPHSGVTLVAVWFAPAIVIGAAIGWLSYSRRWWLYSTGIMVALSLVSILLAT